MFVLLFIILQICKRRIKQDEYFCQSGIDQDGFEKKFISQYVGKLFRKMSLNIDSSFILFIRSQTILLTLPLSFFCKVV